jgi:choline-glycine betaine transporter
VALISAAITGILGLITKIIIDSWPWWGYLVIGVVFFALLGIVVVIIYKCRCGQKLEDQEVKELE